MTIEENNDSELDLYAIYKGIILFAHITIFRNDGWIILHILTLFAVDTHLVNTPGSVRTMDHFIDRHYHVHDITARVFHLYSLTISILFFHLLLTLDGFSHFAFALSVCHSVLYSLQR